MIEVGGTYDTVVNGHAQKWTVTAIEPDTRSHHKRVIINVEEEGKEPWVQAMLLTNMSRRVKG